MAKQLNPCLRKPPKITTPEVPSVDFNERRKATWWRQHRMQMTREELADALSYTPDTIWSFETITRRTPTATRAWRRYKNACELLHSKKFAGTEEPFNWGIVYDTGQ